MTHLGWQTAFRVLPYRMQDQYNRERAPLTFRSVVLENEHLKATFLPFLVVYTRVLNSIDAEVAMYWWTNIAVDEKPDVRVLAQAQTALYGVFEKEGTTFGLGELPGLPSLDGADGTYSLNSTFANEFFFQCDATDSLRPDGKARPCAREYDDVNH